MPRKTDDDTVERGKSKSNYIDKFTTEEYNSDDSFCDDKNDFHDEVEFNVSDRLQNIYQIKSIFINHFNITSRTIGEYINNSEISKLIYYFVKK
jgi:hypothetical protein